LSEQSTTPDLVELVRGILAAANREDWDAILAHYASDAVWDVSEGLGTFEGPSAIRGFWQDWWSSYERLEIDVQEILDMGNGVVLAAFHIKGVPTGTVAEVQTRMALVYEWEDGVIVRVTSYAPIDAGRAAAERLAESRE
jgi:ketosteroid isomerase-like protein